MTGRQDVAADGPVYEFVKNSREVVRIELTEFGGYQLVSVRAWVATGDEVKPTKAGLNLRLEQIDALIRGLEVARAEAMRRGWL